MQKTNFKFLFNFLIASIVCLFPFLVKAATIEELKQQFISVGGSPEGFNKIIEIVEKSQEANKQLKARITEIYNKQFFELMTATNFDYESYIQVYNNLEKEKYNLTNQNLNNMISLLNSLSLNDRKAYASLLYNISNPINSPKPDINTSSTSNNLTTNYQNINPSMTNVNPSAMAKQPT